MKLHKIAIRCAGAVFAVSLAMGAAQAADEPANILKYRQNLMKSVGANISNIAMVAKGEVSFIGNTGMNARAIRDGLAAAGALFPAGTGTEAGETRALPSVWENNAGFVAALENSQAAAEAMIAAADTGDIGEVRKAIGALGKTCGGCHDDFRQKKK
jgi:cytochrome c556